jgi:hypothetical protein
MTLRIEVEVSGIAKGTRIFAECTCGCLSCGDAPAQWPDAVAYALRTIREACPKRGLRPSYVPVCRDDSVSLAQR